MLRWISCSISVKFSVKKKFYNYFNVDLYMLIFFSVERGIDNIEQRPFRQNQLKSTSPKMWPLFINLEYSDTKKYVPGTQGQAQHFI